MARKKDMEPMVTLMRSCLICKERFVLKHPKQQKGFCDQCESTLLKMIMEKRNEQQKIGDSI